MNTPGSPQDSNRFWKTDQVVTCGISRNTEATVVLLCLILATPDILYNRKSRLLVSVLYLCISAGYRIAQTFDGGNFDVFDAFQLDC